LRLERGNLTCTLRLLSSSFRRETRVDSAVRVGRGGVQEEEGNEERMHEKSSVLRRSGKQLGFRNSQVNKKSQLNSKLQVNQIS
jgi:hypothetical protein